MNHNDLLIKINMVCCLIMAWYDHPILTAWLMCLTLYFMWQKYRYPKGYNFKYHLALGLAEHLLDECSDVFYHRAASHGMTHALMQSSDTHGLLVKLVNLQATEVSHIRP